MIAQGLRVAGRRVDRLVGTMGGVVDELLDSRRGLLVQRLGLGAGLVSNAIGVDVGLTDEPGRLLFGDTKSLLKLGAETGVRGSADLVEFFLQIFDDRLQALQLFRGFGALGVRLDELASQLLQGAVDLITLVSAHLGAEGRVIRCHVWSSPGVGGSTLRV